jgi:hypothetical protein
MAHIDDIPLLGNAQVALVVCFHVSFIEFLFSFG